METFKSETSIFSYKGNSEDISLEYGDSDEQRYLGSIDTMPGEDISFDKYDSESGAKIYYYVETLNGEAGDTTYNGKNYKQYKVIDLDYSSYTNLTRVWENLCK